MQLLVSIARTEEIDAAVDGGAHVVDAKDPSRGALGAVEPDVLHAMAAALGGRRPLSAALGDSSDEAAVERAAAEAARAGAAWVKVGFAGVADPARVHALLAAAVDGVAGTAARVVAVAYADAPRAGSIAPTALPALAAAAGAAGVLLDSAFKDGAGLFALLAERDVRAWVEAAHAAGCIAALAGKLDASGVRLARALDADIAGVRGAACEGGRGGHVSAARVRALVAAAAGLERPAAVMLG